MSNASYDSGLAQRGQMTLPKALRDQYQLRVGQPFTIIDLNGKFLVVPKKSRTDEVCNQLRDELLASWATLSDMLAELRSNRESEGRQ